METYYGATSTSDNLVGNCLLLVCQAESGKSQCRGRRRRCCRRRRKAVQTVEPEYPPWPLCNISAGKSRRNVLAVLSVRLPETEPLSSASKESEKRKSRSVSFGWTFPFIVHAFGRCQSSRIECETPKPTSQAVGYADLKPVCGRN